MRLALILLPGLAALSGCGEAPVSRDLLVMPRPAPYIPEPQLGAFGPVLDPSVTVPYTVPPEDTPGSYYTDLVTDLPIAPPDPTGFNEAPYIPPR